VISGIGQGFVLATPLQLAVATATLANGGRRMKPHLVKAIRNTENGRIDPVAPEVVQSISFRPQDLETLRLAMEGVMKPGGTASQAGAGAPYAIAGKTGTAQVVAVRQGEKYNAGALAERNRDHALFIAYAPTDHPRLAIAVLVENGGHGGATAAPIARQVFDYYLLGKVPAPIQPTRSPPADDVPLD
jgi:penicillin-binding protein 2